GALSSVAVDLVGQRERAMFAVGPFCRVAAIAPAGWASVGCPGSQRSRRRTRCPQRPVSWWSLHPRRLSRTANPPLWPVLTSVWLAVTVVSWHTFNLVGFCPINL